jgi:hypothetical protein
MKLSYIILISTIILSIQRCTKYIKIHIKEGPYEITEMEDGEIVAYSESLLQPLQKKAVVNGTFKVNGGIITLTMKATKKK